MKYLFALIVVSALLVGCAGADLNRSTINGDLAAALGSTTQVRFVSRCDYGVSSLGAPSARFQWDGVCVLLEDGFAFLSYNKATQHREFEFRLQRNDVKTVARWTKGRFNQIQLTTNVALVSFNVTGDTGSFQDPALADEMWQGILDQHYVASVASRGIYDERGQVMVLPIITK